MGLTPKGPRPLPSPSPLILGVPKARHRSAQRGSLRAGAILLWESVWLGVLNRSKRSGETAQMSRCDADSVSIGASWTAELCGAGLLFTDGIVGRLMSSSICAVLSAGADRSRSGQRWKLRRSNLAPAMRPNGKRLWRGCVIGRLANRIGDQARFATGLAAAPRVGLRPPPRPFVPSPISFASTRRFSE